MLGRRVGPASGHALEVDAIEGGWCRLVTVPTPVAAVPPSPSLARLALTVRDREQEERLEAGLSGAVSWNGDAMSFRAPATARLLWSLAASAGHCVPWEPLAARSDVPEARLLHHARLVRTALDRRRIRSIELWTVRRRGLLLAPARGREIDVSWET